jgi:hypothetical protein
MSTELIQTVIVSAFALSAALTLGWRFVGPSFTKSTSTSCARCEAGNKCAPAPPEAQLIQIRRRRS